MNLDAAGNSLDDATREVEESSVDDLEWDDEPAYHAPSEYVWLCREQRDARKRRDRNELQDLWREEVQARKRETAFLLYRSAR